MELRKFKQVKKGKFLSSYEITYLNKAGREKIYEMVSRESDLSALSVGKKTAGVAIAGFKDDKVLLIREFRLGVNGYVWAFPAGCLLYTSSRCGHKCGSRRKNVRRCGF